MSGKDNNRRKCDVCGLNYVRSYLAAHKRLHRLQDAAANPAVHDNEEIPSSVATCAIAHITEENVNGGDGLVNVEDGLPMELQTTCDSDPSNEYMSMEEESSETDDESIENHSSLSSCDDEVIEASPTEKCTELISKFLLLWQSTFKISNHAIEAILKFMVILLRLSSNMNIPISSYYKLNKNSSPQEFDKYVVCPICNCVYKPTVELSKMEEGIRVPAKCSNVVFPRHPMRRFRQRCGAELSEVVRRANGELIFKPIKIYCYRGVKRSFGQLVKRAGFEKNCRRCHYMESRTGILSDIYDGRVWKDYKERGLLEDNDLGVMLNVDFFQPFKHVRHSVGVVFLVILNLPREERYKRGNVILVGLIPGPKEPPLMHYLQLLVDELQEACTDGLSLMTFDSPEDPVVIKYACLKNYNALTLDRTKLSGGPQRTMYGLESNNQK